LDKLNKSEHVTIFEPLHHRTQIEEYDYKKIAVCHPSDIDIQVNTSSEYGCNVPTNNIKLIGYNVFLDDKSSSHLDEMLKLQKFIFRYNSRTYFKSVGLSELIYYTIKDDKIIYDNQLDQIYIQGSGNDIEPEEY
jgi:hypothetical protein